MLKVFINNINEGEHNTEFIISPDELQIDTVDVCSDIKISVKLYRSGSQISFKINLIGKYKLQCDRCTEDYISEFSKDFEIIYKYDFEETVKQSDIDDIKYIPPNTRYVDLKEDIRDYILLSVPMRRVPEEINGVCTYCHKKISELLNTEKPEEVNPVWEKLIKTKIK